MGRNDIAQYWGITVEQQRGGPVSFCPRVKFSRRVSNLPQGNPAVPTSERTSFSVGAWCGRRPSTVHRDFPVFAIDGSRFATQLHLSEGIGLPDRKESVRAMIVIVYEMAFTVRDLLCPDLGWSGCGLRSRFH